jgi:sec-independent protein translocase protein TatC
MATKTDDDLFQDTTMTFGEHLDDLRKCLFKAVIALTIGTCAGFYFGNNIVEIIAQPLKNALGNYYGEKSKLNFDAWFTDREKSRQPTYYSRDEVKATIAKGMTFEIRYVDPKQTLNELNGLGSTTSTPLPKPANNSVPPSVPPPPDSDAPKSKDSPESASETKTDKVKEIEIVPILLWLPLSKDGRINPKALSAQEAFSIWLKASMVFGVILSSPVVLYYLWSFVAAGLYPHEKHYVYVFFPFSIGLFLLGAATAYIFVFEPVLNFLFSFNMEMGIDIDPRINEWLSFVLLLPLGFGVGFQLPLVMLFLERLGIFDVQAYREKWRISVLVIFVLSAILTPADPYSLLLMACPMTVLYFGGILLCKWLPRRGGDLAPA